MSAVSKRRALQGASLAALSAAFVQPAAAQDRGFVPDEILVTAQKREERAFDVPIPVVSYDKGFFDTAGIQDIEELSEFVPGLNVQIQSANNPSYVIRGITSDDASTQQPPRVSVYYNGVDISRARGSNFEVFDLDRVEVVKGPQATLFGTAALTGAISVITAKPEKEFSAEAYAGYGADDYTKVGGFVTAGTDTVQGRLAGQYRRRDGYIENLAPGEDDLQGFDVFALRPSFAFTPVDELRVDVVFTYETHDSPGVGFKSGVIAPPGGDTSPFTPAYLSGAFDNATAGSGTAQNGLVRYDGVVTTPGGGFTTSLTPLPNGTVENQLRSNSIGLDRDVYDVSITTEWKIDDTWTLTGIFGYRDYENLETFDADGSVVPLIEISENSSGDQMTGELRFNIDNGSRLKSFFGFNAFVEDAERALPQVVDEAIFGLCLDAASFEVNLATCVGDDGFPLQFGVTPGLGTGIGAPIAAADSPGIYYPISFVDIAENTAYSAFADFTIEITPRFEATIGLRYLKEKREGALASNIPNSYLIETVLLPGVIPGVQALNATLTNPFTNEEIAANFSDFATGNLDAANFEGRTQAELDTLNQTLSGLTPFETTAILQGFFETDGEFTVISIEDEDYLPRFNLLYRVSDTFNVYGSIAKGRRSPVVTFSQNDARTPQFLPAETMWNYEAGFKANFMGGTANLEGSVFFQDYENFTVTDISLLVGEDPVLLTGSKNVGVELFALARVFEGFDVGGTFAWIDSEIDDDPANGEFAGKRFRLQPEYSGSLFFDYTRPITSGNEAFITSTYSYRSKVFFEPSNEPIAGFDIFEDDVHLIDLRLGISSEAQGWEVAGFITNLTDEEYLVDGGNVGGGLGIPTFIAGPPRLWGVEIRKKF